MNLIRSHIEWLALASTVFVARRKLVRKFNGFMCCRVCEVVLAGSWVSPQYHAWTLCVTVCPRVCDTRIVNSKTWTNLVGTGLKL